jgi:UDP-GlcNAc3NAcA epimerase
MKTLLTVIGTRPQFIKLAALARELDQGFRHVVVDTGQHYDHLLAGAFLDEFSLRPPDHVIALDHGHGLLQIAAILEQLHDIIGAVAPDATLCFGDTNSTLAAGIAAVKHGVPLIHMEAGERNVDLNGVRVPPASMPEETNRVVVDHLSSLLLCVSDRSAARLREESVTGRIDVTGDILYDVFLSRRGALAEDSAWLAGLSVHPRSYYFATVHRAINTDHKERLAAILRALSRCDAPVVLPLHPRTARMMDSFGLSRGYESHPVLRLIPPVNHLQSLTLASRARAVLTDSGGVMREAYFLRVPSVCLDDTTAWIDICQAGWSRLAGADEAAIHAALAAPVPAHHPPLFGHGDAVSRTLTSLRDVLC